MKLLFTPQSLKAAYEDLAAYTKALRRCIRACNNPTDVKLAFPDCVLLDRLGFTTSKAVDRKRYSMPWPSDVAESVLTAMAGIDKSTLLRHIRKARPKE
jgi:hypothetical protein